MAADEPRVVDPGMVLVELDEVKTKAQATTGRKQLLTYTGLVLVAGLQYLLADATAEGLFEQLAGLLCRLDVLDGTRQVLVLADGASWIRSWFEGLGLVGQGDDRLLVSCDETVLSGPRVARASPRSDGEEIQPASAGSVVGGEGGGGARVAAGLSRRGRGSRTGSTT